MEVVKISVYVQPGKPAAVGHVGTVVVTPAKDGEFLVEFTLRRKGARRLGLSCIPKLDKRKRKRNTDRN